MSLKTITAALIAGASLIAAPAFAEDVKIGVTPGPHAQIMEQVKPLFEAKGHTLEILEFSDYVIPNEALSNGDLTANAFQHQPYLDNQIADRGYKIETVAVTVNFPIAVYSDKFEKFEDLPEGAKIGLPNDPTNGGRVLLLLESAGLIKLKEGVGTKASVIDVIENPKNVQFLEIDAAQLARTLPDLDAAGINTNYAEDAGLDPVNGSILRESPTGPYVNVIAVRSDDKDQQWVKDLVAAYHSDEVKAFIDTEFKGSILAGW